MSVKYIAKFETWFDEGTEAKLIEGPWEGNPPFALFEGIKDGGWNREVCMMTEFEIVDV